MFTLTDAPKDRNEGVSPDANERRDRAWLLAIAQGDRNALAGLYICYRPRLARFLVRHTARRDLVDEIVNETLWIVWRTAAAFRGDSKVGTWIIGIAYRRLLKAQRDRPLPESASVADEADAFDDASSGATGENELRETRDWVRRGIDLLPKEQRLTIELAYFPGQSCEEIAAIMECAVGTVKARMFHARVRLRNTLPALGGDHSAAQRRGT
jgi:RNA polymerase sigma-70 factor (ECF subfamily)